MKASQPNDDRQKLDLEENDPVWQLLGESPRPEPDAWFTVRTLARCREAGRAVEARAVFFGGALWRWALGGGLGVCLAVFLLVPQQRQASSVMPAQQKNVQEAFAVLASLPTTDADSDTDTDGSSSSTSWQDSSSL